MKTIQMIESSFSEALHLFEVMEKHSAMCGLEMKIEGMCDPIVAISYQPVKAEYIENAGDGDVLVVHLGETELCFMANLSIHKYISDCQISLCISDDKYTAWFDSGSVSPEAIIEANSYKEPEDFEPYSMEVNAYEEQLIEFIRTLDFGDLLAANGALEKSAKDAQEKACKHIKNGSLPQGQGWQNLSINLMKLADLLAESNADYRHHIIPEDQ